MMAEKDYIEREAAIDAVKKERNYTGKFTFEEEHAWAVGFQQGITFALSDIAAIPAADVRPVVRGQWKLDSDPGEPWRYVCNICGEKTKDTVMGKPRANYCPNCGADMREER